MFSFVSARPLRRAALVAGAASCAAVVLSAPASAAPSQLQLGDTGASVVCLQKGLNLEYSDWTSNSSPLATDGIFGTATRNAVNDHKSWFGLTTDGIFGKGAGDAMISLSYTATANGRTAATTWRNGCASQIPHN
ncbi:putative peptidoglycan binding protein [Actinocorallia herbida]|uniref:Putative peptidoglycan binding protein n=1 Tax=Actinocorallia herbida TaxID=58109 RepID=A0A3N1D0E3_9ACTN|nr:peptidoglycan-binding domain-containing protein [Actinocorallia herbida]ROO86976.1 putative peptidoglycan binding protein [Actinocorallia herbida]